MPSLRTYNLTNKGLLLLFGIDVCDIDRGLWFVPKYIGKIIEFTVSIQEYQFPSDSIGEEHDQVIRISTGQHLVLETDKKDNTVKTLIQRASEMSEDGVLNKIIMLEVSPMVVFRFKDARLLFKNFSDIYFSDGEAGVSAEIARQIRDHIVSEATLLFPRYTAEEIFHKMDDLNDIIKEKVLHDVADWGIELIHAKLTTVHFDKSVEKYLDDVVRQNTEAIGHFLEAQKESEAYRLFTEVRKERAAALNGPDGDKLKLVFQMEAAVAMAQKSTNYNIGNFESLGLTGLLKEILSNKS